jgi:hypothetical protein
MYNGTASFTVLPTGSIELGRKDAAATAQIDFHSSGDATGDFDTRILSSGGVVGSTGQGSLTYTALRHRFSGNVISDVDAAASIGGPNNRFDQGYIRTVRPGDGSVIWTSGNGSPEGVLTAKVGSLYTRTDGGAGTTLYVKETGTGNTGWVAK